MKRLLTVQSVLLAASLVLMPLTHLHAKTMALPDFAELNEQHGPAVVNISIKQKKTSSRQELGTQGLPENSPFRDFFEHFFEGMPNERIPRGFETASLGSGFIISDDGYILTAAHVVQSADEILVKLNDRREFEAKVIGADPRSDVAVLKIEAKDLPFTKIGDDDKLRVGDWVLAIGSPFGFDRSATKGIVSAKGRNLPNDTYVPFIQTDVPINPGNSGGPLFNLDGEVVGINSQIFSKSGGYMGVSFAIPISIAMNVADQLRENGQVSRGWLGVLIQDVDRDLAASFGMDHPHGALVAQVLEDSPAQAGGLEVGDVILSFNKRRITDSGVLPPIVGSTPVDQAAPVLVLRNGERKTLSVTIGKLPDEEQLAEARSNGSAPSQSKSKADERLGLAFDSLTQKQRSKAKMPSGGAQVSELKDGPAAQAGLRRGDIVTMINGERVKNADHATELLKALPDGRNVAILVQRDSGPLFLALRIPKA